MPLPQIGDAAGNAPLEVDRAIAGVHGGDLVASCPLALVVEAPHFGPDGRHLLRGAVGLPLGAGGRPLFLLLGSSGIRIGPKSLAGRTCTRDPSPHLTACDRC